MQPANPNDAAGIPVGRFGITNETADRAVTMLTNGYLTGTIDLGGVYPPTDPGRSKRRCGMSVASRQEP
jgi:hypothetical protein